MLFEGLTYLSTLKPWDGRAQDFSLDAVRLVAAYLGNPQDTFRSIHVAGTNGKGSVCALLSSILANDGKKIGMTISPHLTDVCERVVIDGVNVEPEILSNAALQVKIACSALKASLTHFEAVTLCGFLIFRAEQVDFAVVECGLGGRLDATNIISKPDISAIVSVNKDHEIVLGHTLKAIAIEKCGIIKPNGKVVFGNLYGPEQALCREMASRQGAISYGFGEDFGCSQKSLKSKEPYYSFWTSLSSSRYSLVCPLSGEHQANNIAIACQMAKLLGISDSAIIEGIRSVNWPGRLEAFKAGKLNFLFDCAHNPAAISSLIRYLESKPMRRILVFGVLADKNWPEMVMQLHRSIKQFFIIEPESDRAVPASEIAALISKHEGAQFESFGSNYTQLISRLAQVESDTEIVVTGSIYLVGRLRQLLKIPWKPLWTRSMQVSRRQSA